MTKISKMDLNFFRGTKICQDLYEKKLKSVDYRCQFCDGTSPLKCFHQNLWDYLPATTLNDLVAICSLCWNKHQSKLDQCNGKDYSKQENGELRITAIKNADKEYRQERMTEEEKAADNLKEAKKERNRIACESKNALRAKKRKERKNKKRIEKNGIRWLFFEREEFIEKMKSLEKKVEELQKENNIQKEAMRPF